MSQSKNVVLAMATGYSPEQLKPFLHSLRNVFFQRIVIFISSNQRKVMSELAKQYDVQLIDCVEQPNLLPYLSRYFSYQEYLIVNPHIQNVFLCDSRDILFQSSPFTNDATHLYLYAEPMKIGHCQINSRWISTLYGPEFLSAIEHQPILCSGTTLGSYGLILDYVNAICAQIHLHQQAGKSFLAGHDQGIHNYLYYANKLPKAQIREHGYSEVQTLHHETILSFDRDSFLLNQDGTRVPVVHQYDRHPNFAHNFAKILGEQPIPLHFPHIALDATIACVVSGDGLVKSTLQALSSFGADQASILDVGGHSSSDDVCHSLRILLGNQNTKAILVNIFGSHLNCLAIAQGITQACHLSGLSMPIVVRMQGIDEVLALDVLIASGLPIHSCRSVTEAAKQAVQCATSALI